MGYLVIVMTVIGLYLLLRFCFGLYFNRKLFRDLDKLEEINLTAKLLILYLSSLQKEADVDGSSAKIVPVRIREVKHGESSENSSCGNIIG